jgi:hypothetical protein
MKFSVMAALLAVALLTVATSADARNYRHHHHAARIQATDANGNRASGLVTVPTAAGINITCSTAFAGEAASLIADAVAHGIKFTRITCHSTAHSHKYRHGACVSNHCTGDAMDTHPSIPAHLVREAGLRSGCDFRDCPHVDNARNVGGVAFWNSVKHRHYAMAGRSTRSYAARRHHRRYASR